MELVTVALNDIYPYQRNARKNEDAIPAVMESIRQCEYIATIIIDENHVILAGHTRWKALKKLGYDKAECVVKAGLTDEQKRKYRLLDNKTTELADWDFDLLPEELDGLDFEGLELDWGVEVETPKPDIVEDDYDAEPPAEPKAKRGDIYQLGRHRLMCGDSTNAEDVAALMSGEKADMVFTDPPYNVAIGSKNKALNDVCKANKRPMKGGRIEEDIENDNGMTDEEIGETLWKPAFINMRDFANDHSSIYVTMPQGRTHMIMMMMMNAAWQVKHELIWVKNQPTFSMRRLDYDYQHEPICYGWNKSHNFYGNGEQKKSIWHFDKPRESKLHPTMKPIGLIANAILNSSKDGDLVLDVFGGSGSTLIACEETGRCCCMMELDPKYVDVIIDRWEKFTGERAVLIEHIERRV